MTEEWLPSHWLMSRGHTFLQVLYDPVDGFNYILIYHTQTESVNGTSITSIQLVPVEYWFCVGSRVGVGRDPAPA